jgi:polysaccharide biosynthesis transport protein
MPQQNPGDQEAGLLDILAIVRRRFWLIVFGLAVGVGLGALYHFKATPMYESKVEILVMSKDSNLPSQGSGASDFQQQSAGEDILATHIQLFQSPRVVREAFEKNNLGALASLAKAIAEDKNPITHIIENLEVTRGGEGKAKDASVLAAKYTGPSPDDCAQILDALVASYQDLLGEFYNDTSSEAVDLITEAMERLGEKLQQKETTYREFRVSAPLIWKGENSLNIHQERLASAERALSEIAINHTEAKARLEVIKEALAENENLELSDVERLALLSANDVERLNLLLSATGHDRENNDWLKYREEDPVRQESAQTEYQRLLSLLLEESALLEDFAGDHPDVLAIRQKIKLTQDFLAKNAAKAVEEVEEEDNRLKPAELLAAHVGLLKHDLRELEKQRIELEALADREEGEAKKLAIYDIDDKLKSAELDRLRELHDAVVARLGEINLIKDYGGFLTEIISPVERAEKPSWPVLPLVLALGGICGLFFGCGLAYLVELSDRTFRSPEELHQALRLPIMAHIPGTGIKRRKRQAAAASNGQPAIDASVITAHRPASRFAEVFRGLRTALRFSATGSACGVIQVTSANPRDGKTTVATNLAVSAAQSGKRVLIIDGDLRRPRVDAAFGIKAETGLVEVLAGDAELLDTVCESSIENLWLLPCGKKPSNPAEILSSPEFEQLVEMVREHYDLVIIDSPPILAVSDPMIIAPRVDGVLLTVRITKHGRPEVIQAREILTSLDVKILGVVVNGSGKNVGYGYGYGRKSYGHGYGYGYSYGYGYGSGNGTGTDGMNRYYGAEDKAAANA